MQLADGFQTKYQKASEELSEINAEKVKFESQVDIEKVRYQEVRDDLSQKETQVENLKRKQTKSLAKQALNNSKQPAWLITAIITIIILIGIYFTTYKIQPRNEVINSIIQSVIALYIIISCWMMFGGFSMKFIYLKIKKQKALKALPDLHSKFHEDADLDAARELVLKEFT